MVHESVAVAPAEQEADLVSGGGTRRGGDDDRPQGKTAAVRDDTPEQDSGLAGDEDTEEEPGLGGGEREDEEQDEPWRQTDQRIDEGCYDVGPPSPFCSVDMVLRWTSGVAPAAVSVHAALISPTWLNA